MEDKKQIEEAVVTEETISPEQIEKNKFLERRKRMWLNDVVKKCAHERFKTLNKKDRIIQCRNCKLIFDLKNEVIYYHNENLNIEPMAITIQEQPLQSVDTEVIKKRQMSEGERLYRLIMSFNKHIF